MRPYRLAPLLAGLLAGALACAHPPQQATPKPNIDPGSLNRPTKPIVQDTTPAVAAAARPVQPDVAYARGLMPLAPTGVDAFRKSHPAADGRGVIIGILDSGIDAAADGLGTTSTGERKILDLRDFSGEGTVALAPVRPRGDTVVVGGIALAGFGRVAALDAQGPWYAGTIREIPLGKPPASDLNGNGTDGDTFAVVVARASDGWVLFADTDGDGSLANERPVRDFLVARETFGWHVRGRPSPLTVAVNLRAPNGTPNGAPQLDLFFDTSGHGSHVAGIAAGHAMYGVKGFDGVAPGAWLLGLKIADNAQGGISTTGSMLRAMDYAIRFARQRHLPLVLNMSFGVGNEVEGTARIDRIIDSVLALNPDVAFAISAGNDGPGLSTMGFPGSAERVLTVGALYPAAFFGQPAAPSPVAFFSSRGAELAKPDLVTPGVAYSTVPRWNTGDEIKGGTSMASPHAAGLAALLVSALSAAKQPIDARLLRQALMVTARPIAGDSWLDAGAGVPDVGAAFQWLQRNRTLPEIAVRALGEPGRPTAGWRERVRAGGFDTTQTFELTRLADAPPLAVTLRSDAPWLRAPARATLAAGTSRLTVRYRADALTAPGVYTGIVTGWTADTTLGPVFRLVNTVVVPVPAGTALAAGPVAVKPSEVRRFFFPADSARPFAVTATTTSGQTAMLYLHEPDGMPFRDQAGAPAGQGDERAIYQVDARDVVAGVYEADVVGAASGDGAVTLDLIQAPVTLGVARGAAGVTATLRAVAADTVRADLLALVVGGQRSETVTATGSGTQRIPFRIPAWARSVVVDVTMDRAEWSRFTDFGVTLFDSAGRQIEQSPLNYALGRLRADLPAGHGGIAASLGLFPAFADPDPKAPWTARVAIRLYADSAATLVPANGAAGAGGANGADGQSGRSASVVIAPGRTATATFTVAQAPWALGDGFVPLGALVARIDGHIWTREATLSQPNPPVMR